MENSAFKADELNADKGFYVAQVKQGVSPKRFKKDPIRKRAYYRALKRNETWALMRKVTKDNMRLLNEMMIKKILYGDENGKQEDRS